LPYSNHSIDVGRATSVWTGYRDVSTVGAYLYIGSAVEDAGEAIKPSEFEPHCFLHSWRDYGVAEDPVPHYDPNNPLEDSEGTGERKQIEQHEDEPKTNRQR
jgi:hypothetical protein